PWTTVIYTLSLHDALPISEEFEAAVYALEEGEVSPPVVTDAGTHFIKVTRKIEAEPPTYDERKDVIADQLKRMQAETTYVTMLRSEEHTSELQSRENLVCR